MMKLHMKFENLHVPCVLTWIMITAKTSVVIGMESFVIGFLK
jgi:hypothetical protein